MRRDFYCRHLANDVYATVRDGSPCARNRQANIHQRKLHLFPPNNPLYFVSIDILGSWHKTRRGIQFLIVITDCFSNLSKAIPTSQTSATIVAKEFVEHWISNYGIPGRVPTDNGQQLVSNFFKSVFAYFRIEALTSEYHCQCNGQAERLNRTLVPVLRHYVAEHQEDLDSFVYPLTYTYNVQIHRSAKLSPFYLVLGRSPLGPASLRPSWHCSDEKKTETTLFARIRLIHRASMLQRLVDFNVKKLNYNINKTSTIKFYLNQIMPLVITFLTSALHWRHLQWRK